MPYSVEKTEISDILILDPDVYSDDRGFFLESFNQKAFEEATGVSPNFVQDNHSRSSKGVLRGLHYQIENPQGKLVRVTNGEVFDVVVDIRGGSSDFGRWVGIRLSGENKKQLWIPPGFAHGFLVLTESADFLYKTTDYRYAEHERTIAWDDPAIAIEWPLLAAPILSKKDAIAGPLASSQTYSLDD